MQFPKNNYTKQREARRKNRNSKKSRVPENVLQQQAEQLLDNMGIVYIRIPDQVYKLCSPRSSVPAWGKQLISKYLKGLPDLTLLFQSGRFKCIELKTNIGKLSIGQKRFKNIVGVDNYKIVRSLEELKNIVLAGGQE